MVRGLNKKLFAQAKKYLVGGVNSPVRSFCAVGGGPIFVKSAKGPKIYSQDGREFIDYCLSWGALILGHSHPKVTEALREAIAKGVSFGAATKLETELAEIIAGAMPSIERIRLTNSGTEAVMGAIRLSRAFTKRDKIIKFSGSYHGSGDYLLNCPGVPKSFIQHALIAPYNDLEKLEGLAARYKNDIAAIILEPVAANMGVVLPKEGFLEGLRKVADKYHIVLIFDEVITGFRLAFGGAQEYFKVRPDLTILGKIIGGGLPIGAFAGKKEIMRLLAPEGNVYQAGTFSGNPVSVSAGLATLKILSRLNPYVKLEKETRGLCAEIQVLAAKRNIKFKADSVASIFGFSAESALFRKFYRGLLNKGIYFSPSSSEANFLSLAHRAPDLEKTLKAIDEVFIKIGG